MAVSITLHADTAQVDAMARHLAAIPRQIPWVTAGALTDGVKAARDGIRRDVLPLVRGGPTRWTTRGLIVRYARPTDLNAAAGFNYDQTKESTDFFAKLSDSGRQQFKGGGVPSGRYMEINAKGGMRSPKSSELGMRRTGKIANNKFLVPNQNLKEIDKHGNLPGKYYTQALSRVGGIFSPGSTQNRPAGAGSRGRTARKARQSDFFIMYRKASQLPERVRQAARELGGDERLARFMLEGQQEPLYIARRVGRGRRGFEPFLWITDAPRYERKFPVIPVAEKEFHREFGRSFMRRAEHELSRRK